MVKVFGQEAEAISSGDEYRAVVKSVEGKNVVELYPVCKVCREIFHPSEDTRGTCIPCLEEQDRLT